MTKSLDQWEAALQGIYTQDLRHDRQSGPVCCKEMSFWERGTARYSLAGTQTTHENWEVRAQREPTVEETSCLEAVACICSAVKFNMREPACGCRGGLEARYQGAWGIGFQGLQRGKGECE